LWDCPFANDKMPCEKTPPPFSVVVLVTPRRSNHFLAFKIVLSSLVLFPFFFLFIHFHCPFRFSSHLAKNGTPPSFTSTVYFESFSYLGAFLGGVLFFPRERLRSPIAASSPRHHLPCTLKVSQSRAGRPLSKGAFSFLSPTKAAFSFERTEGSEPSRTRVPPFPLFYERETRLRRLRVRAKRPIPPTSTSSNAPPKKSTPVDPLMDKMPPLEDQFLFPLSITKFRCLPCLGLKEIALMKPPSPF